MLLTPLARDASALGSIKVEVDTFTSDSSVTATMKVRTIINYCVTSENNDSSLLAVFRRSRLRSFCDPDFNLYGRNRLS